MTCPFEVTVATSTTGLSKGFLTEIPFARSRVPELGGTKAGVEVWTRNSYPRLSQLCSPVLIRGLVLGSQVAATPWKSGPGGFETHKGSETIYPTPLMTIGCPNANAGMRGSSPIPM